MNKIDELLAAVSKFPVNFSEWDGTAGNQKEFSDLTHELDMIRHLAYDNRQLAALLRHLADPKSTLDDLMRAHIAGAVKMTAMRAKETEQANIEAMAYDLIKLAELQGMVVRIETRPLQPLAMGNYEMVATVQERRTPGVPYADMKASTVEEAPCTRCGKPWADHEFGVPAPYCP